MWLCVCGLVVHVRSCVIACSCVVWFGLVWFDVAVAVAVALVLM